MDYLTLIAQQKQDKFALVEDEEEYTYARLVQEARSLRSKADFSAPAVFIHESSIARQLISFLAYSGTKTGRTFSRSRIVFSALITRQ